MLFMNSNIQLTYTQEDILKYLRLQCGLHTLLSYYGHGGCTVHISWLQVDSRSKSIWLVSEKTGKGRGNITPILVISVGTRDDLSLNAISHLVINPAVGCRYFPQGPQLPLSIKPFGWHLITLLGEQEHMIWYPRFGTCYHLISRTLKRRLRELCLSDALQILDLTDWLIDWHVWTTFLELLHGSNMAGSQTHHSPLHRLAIMPTRFWKLSTYQCQSLPCP